MPAGTIRFTAQSTPPGDPPGAQTLVTYTSGPVVTNRGAPVADGTLFTVMALDPSGAGTPFGTVMAADENAQLEGVQVRAQNGVIRFTVSYPAGGGLATALAYSAEGTALGVELLPLRPLP
jgi:hypothetical protein